MPLTGSAFLALWNDFDPARDAEYNRWHTFEHVPERVGVAGFLSGRRYVARERRDDRYFTLYELDALSALDGRAYADVVDHPTAWSLLMRPSFRRFRRHPCATLLSLGTGIAGSLATFCFALGDPAAALDVREAQSVLQPFLETAGVASLHLGQVDRDATFPVKNAAPTVAADAVRFVLLAEGIERAALDDAAPAIAVALERGLGARRPEWKTFDLAYSIERSELRHPTTERQPQRHDLRTREDGEPGA